MSQQSSRDENLWSLVLAGGEGERMRPFVQRWLGQHKPKQYCTFVGTRSMFQHTLDRSDKIVAPERRVTIIARDHREEALSQFSSRTAGKVIFQPSNRETAAGIFLGLTYIRNRDPSATVVIFPSDHFVYPEDRFLRMVTSMASAATSMGSWILILGVSPTGPEPDYGWVLPGSHLGWIDGYPVQAAEAFLEKPNMERCTMALDAGALWNSMVMAARIETLWSLGSCCFPEMMRLFEVYGEVVGTAQEEVVLDGTYEVMPSRNFSSHFLQEFPRHVAVMEMQDVLWSDWGKPERVARTLRQIGRVPEECWTQMAATGSPDRTMGRALRHGTTGTT
jgi:mannose-1-phosphate guanylyltransferase